MTTIASAIGDLYSLFRIGPNVIAQHDNEVTHQVDESVEISDVWFIEEVVDIAIAAGVALCCGRIELHGLHFSNMICNLL